MDARGIPAPAARSARWKRVGIGCLAVLGVTAIIGTVVGALLLKRRYPQIFEMGQASQEMMKRASSSPAVQELNRSLCSEALVLATDDVNRLQGILGKGSDQIPTQFRFIVSCHVRDASAAPGCDEVARVYRRATTEAGRFVVVVTAGLFRASGKPVCSTAYDEHGKPLRRAAGGDGHGTSEN